MSATENWQPGDPLFASWQWAGAIFTFKNDKMEEHSLNHEAARWTPRHGWMSPWSSDDSDADDE